jgi:hypothetical protein
MDPNVINRILPEMSGPTQPDEARQPAKAPLEWADAQS